MIGLKLVVLGAGNGLSCSWLHFSSLFLFTEWESFRPFDTVTTCETLMLSNSAANIKSGTVLAMSAVLVHKQEPRVVSFTQTDTANLHSPVSNFFFPSSDSRPFHTIAPLSLSLCSRKNVQVSGSEFDCGVHPDVL